ncbi:MAG: hypothetical protein M3P94_07445 [Chloroflexota bacterium]|nr:hypothetical protein [Chloroflexota bacterium]MDQ3514801.1 hypothetical protein [Chloroflexota bacterium]
MDVVEALAGVPVVVIVPACVEVAKRAGLPTRFAGLVAIASATLLVALADLALGAPTGLDAIARWLLLGGVHGLAGAGLYSQIHRLGPDPVATAVTHHGPDAPIGSRPEAVPAGPAAGPAAPRH